MERLYKNVIQSHFSEHNQMVLVSGPRQVGKTTLAKSIQGNEDFYYFNWDDVTDREVLLQGGQSIAQAINLERLRETRPLVIFDEIHKYAKWKQLLKGFYDRYMEQTRILVTGSARMDVFKKGGDSLMGRYFNYRLHPLSVNELTNRPLAETEIREPQKISSTDFERLLNKGGFPEPFLKNDQRFSNRWSNLRSQQLLQEDVREIANVQGIGQLEVLAMLLKNQAGQLTSYSSLAKKVRVSVDTIRRWISILESLYYCFSVRPWTKNISRSILKEPKYYLWDWSQCVDSGAKNENFVASHLLKAVHFWTDQGFGDYKLHFLRDKEKREVDFLVSRDNQPWFMVEVKSSAKNRISPSLEIFRNQLDVEHVFQVVIDEPYIDQNVFEIHDPVIVPAKTFLSQLI